MASRSACAPGAEAKLFVTARPEVRAHRRFLELLAAGHAVREEQLLAEIEARDARDSGRADAPLAQAADAVKKLDLDEHTPVFDELVRLKAQQLAISSLVETRYLHHAAALNLQADLRLQVENLRASKKLIEEQLADVNARMQKLEA